MAERARSFYLRRLSEAVGSAELEQHLAAAAATRGDRG